MWVTSRSHYGLIAMVNLARAYGQGPVSLSEIAQGEHLPLTYLEQLVMPLRKAGLVRGSRGQHGGYQLTEPPEQVTVQRVVWALDGSLAPVECVGANYQQGTCVRESTCTSKLVWRRLKESIDDVLNSITLADLGQEQEDSLHKVGSIMELMRSP